MDSNEKKFNKAVMLFNNGENSNALELLNIILLKNKIHFDSNALKGIILANEKKYEESELFFTIANELRPDNKSIIYNLALVQQNLKKFDDAIENYKKIIKSDSNNCNVFNNLANIYYEKEDLNNALILIMHSLEINRSQAKSLNTLANIYFKQEKYSDALQIYDESLNQEDDIDTNLNKVRVLIKLGETKHALQIINSLIKENPNNKEAVEELINIYIESSQYEEAEQIIKYSLKINNKDINSIYKYGLLFARQKKSKASIEQFNIIINEDDKFYAAYLERSLQYRDIGLMDKALEDIENAIECNEKNFKIKALINKGIYNYELLNYIDSYNSFKDATTLDPENNRIKFNLSLLQLQNKELKSGLLNYRCRVNLPELDNPKILPNIKVWNGIEKINSLLIIGEQGIGDQIFYLTYLDYFTEEKKIYVTIDKRLHELFQFNYPNITFLDKNNVDIFKKINKIDAQIAMCDLLYFLIKDHLPARKIFKQKLNYNKITELRKSITNKIIGISWSSSNRLFGENKSIDLNQFIQYLPRDNNITYISLQYDDDEFIIEEIKNNYNINIIGAKEYDIKNNINNLFQIIDMCDLVITVSNINAHVAGVLKKITWVLVPKGKGRLWYWHSESINIWYQNLEIFFNESFTDWSDTLSKIKKRILQIV